MNPMVILGIAIGSYIMHFFSENEVIELFKNKNFYTALFILAFMFAFFFERVYHPGGKNINWKALFGITMGRFLTLVITIAFTVLFIFSFYFGDLKETEQKTPDILQQTKSEEIIFK